MTVNNIAKIRGQEKLISYPQAEAILGDNMVKFSQDLGNKSNFGLALFDVGETLHQIAELKHLLENKIKQNFIEPFTFIKHNELKNIMVKQ